VKPLDQRERVEVSSSASYSIFPSLIQDSRLIRGKRGSGHESALTGNFFVFAFISLWLLPTVSKGSSHAATFPIPIYSFYITVKSHSSIVFTYLVQEGEGVSIYAY